MSKTVILMVSGIVIGWLALALSHYGNPPNMGACVACFLRDVSGGMKMHSATSLQYMRPEIFGFVLGAFLMALAFKEFRPRAGSSPMIRFSLGFLMMVGCLVFLGCPLRMVLRIAGGDWNALIGLAGFICGIGGGALFLKRDFALPANQTQTKAEGMLFPLLCAFLLALTLWKSEWFASSQQGAGAMRAPLVLSLIAGWVIGGIVQRTRFCFIGMVNHIFLFGRWSMALGVAALTAAVLIGNIVLGQFHGGFAGQPIAHTDGVWNFLSMALVGWCGVYLGGCPLRQIVSAGQGDGDAAMVTLGMLMGAAAAYNFNLASTVAGPTDGGKITIVIGLVLVGVMGGLYLKRATSQAEAGAEKHNR
ncbi:MAG: YedE family putative selenium transporter [Proteobacteria bacterium]|nr:YedE family putative selenium transporter [Pseudomonadota bacterium]MCL2308238.1 YedE family putative selenium transporter [Pseudomonadota bacterium]